MRVVRQCAYCGKEVVTGGRGQPDHDQRFCGHECAQRAQFPDPLTRFWLHVQKPNDSNSCWIWTGARSDPNGYGVFHGSLRKLTLAHRFSYELHIGPIPKGRFVCHSCDNRPCVNPAHLFVGTAHENSLDAARKGRMTNPNNPSRKAGHYHKLSPDDIPQIYAMRDAGVRAKDIALKFGISKGHVSRILHPRAK